DRSRTPARVTWPQQFAAAFGLRPAGGRTPASSRQASPGETAAWSDTRGYRLGLAASANRAGSASAPRRAVRALRPDAPAPNHTSQSSRALAWRLRFPAACRQAGQVGL